MPANLWTKNELKLAFHLYFQLSFGKLHQRNPEVIELAKMIGRTPSAVAMKLSNFAGLDPKIRDSGRRGLSGASELDREVWAEFHKDWGKLAGQAEQLRKKLDGRLASRKEIDTSEGTVEDYFGDTRQVTVLQRRKQAAFRRVVLSGYGEKCCMSGLAEPRLLVASHIVPWSQDSSNRLNPSNGLCLSAIHDRAFDRGLITIADDFTIVVSKELKRKKDDFLEKFILSLSGKELALPARFQPKREFLNWHRTRWFVDAR